jgi:hypothetical protein
VTEPRQAPFGGVHVRPAGVTRRQKGEAGAGSDPGSAYANSDLNNSIAFYFTPQLSESVADISKCGCICIKHYSLGNLPASEMLTTH